MISANSFVRRPRNAKGNAIMRNCIRTAVNVPLPCKNMCLKCTVYFVLVKELETSSMARLKVLQPFAKAVVECFQSCLADYVLYLRGAIILALHSSCGKLIVTATVAYGGVDFQVENN